MAKQKETEAVVPVGTTALATAAVPDYLQQFVGQKTGGENITPNDIRPPRLKLAQALSPQVKRGKPEFIDGLKVGEFFDTLTGEIFGEGPLDIVFLQFLGHRHIEFAPMSEGGGVVDMDVRDDDPRTKFTVTVKDGKPVRTKPVATKFYDYLILLLVNGEARLMTWSMKGMMLRKAEELNSLINPKKTKLPPFTLLFHMSSVLDAKANDNYNVIIRRDPVKDWCPQHIVEEAVAYIESLKGKTIQLDDESVEEGHATDDDLAPF